MGYIITPKGTAVVEHAASKKRNDNVQLTEVGTSISVSKPLFKEDSEFFNATFEGGFQIDVDAKRTIAGKLTVIVQYSDGLDGPEVEGTVDSSLTLPSCEVIELPEFV